MSYIFDYSHKVTFEQKLQELEHDIQRFTKAWNSEWPRSIDQANLIEAKHALKTLMSTASVA